MSKRVKKDVITEDDLLKLGLALDPQDPTRSRMIKVGEIEEIAVASPGAPPELPPHTEQEIDDLTALIRALGPLSAAVVARLPDGKDFVVQGRGMIAAAKRSGRAKDVVVIPVVGLSEQGAKWLRLILELAGRDKSKLRALRQEVVKAFPTLSPRELESLIPSIDHVTWWRAQREARGVSSETPAPLLTTSFARATQSGKLLDNLESTKNSLPPGTHSPRKARREAWQAKWRQEHGGPLPELDEIAFHHCAYEDIEGIVGDLSSLADCCLLDPAWGAKPAERTRIAEMAGRITRPAGVLACYVGEYWDYEWETEFRTAGFHKLGSICMLNGVSVEERRVQLEGQDPGVALRGATKFNAKWRHCKRTVLLMIKGNARVAHKWNPYKIIDTAFCSNEKKIKRHTMDWAQPLPEAVFLLERLTKTGDLVVDFCCGSGTVGVACAVLGGRRYIGCDRSREEICHARRWLTEVKTGPPPPASRSVGT